MKKFVLLFLTLVGMVGTASAGDNDYYVVGTFNSWSWSDDYIMTQGTDGIYTVTVNLGTISDGTTLEYKVTKGKTWVETYGNSTAGNMNYTVNNTGSGTYKATFKFKPDGTYSDGSHLACEVIRTDDIYLTWGSSNDPSEGQLMTNTDGVYTATVTLESGKCVLVVPSSAWSGTAISNWTNVAYPVTSSGWYNLYVQHMNGNTENSTANNYQRWYVSEAATYTFTYDSHYNTFTTDATVTDNMGEAGWRTYSIGNYEGYFGYTISGNDVAAYYVSGTDNGKATLTAIPNGSVIPTKAGVMLKGSGSFTVTTTGNNAIDLSSNLLVGSGSETTTVPSGAYILANGGEGLGFYPIDENDNTLAANKAYLVTGSTARSFISFTDGTNSINAVEKVGKRGDIYNLSGQRVAQPTKGLYIVDGKKVMMK